MKPEFSYILYSEGKKQISGPDPAKADLPERTKVFIIQSLSPYYRRTWNKSYTKIFCKKLNGKQEVNQHYTINVLIRFRIEESGQAKIVTQMVDLHNLFLDIEIDSL